MDLTFGLFKMLVRFPARQTSTRGDCDSVPGRLDLGAFEHGLSVANTYLFYVSLPGLACVCDKSHTGRRQVVPGAFPFTQLEVGGRGMVFLAAALWVKGWTGREAAALAPTSDHAMGGKDGPETPAAPLDVLF